MNTSLLLVFDRLEKLPLCYRCRGISVNTVFTKSNIGGFFHSSGLEEVTWSSADCAMCKLICDGLSADIADKFEDDSDTKHDVIIIRPDVYCVSQVGGKKSYQAGLRVWSVLSHAACMFNWYLPHNGINLSSLL